MSGAEIFVFVFVSVIFIAGISFGIYLFRWNQRDRKNKGKK